MQQLVGVMKIFAEKSAARFRERPFFHFAPDAAEGFADLAITFFLSDCISAIFDAHYVGLLAVLEMLAARADPVLALDEHAGKLGVISEVMI